MITAVLVCVVTLPVAVLLGTWTRAELADAAERQARVRIPAVGTVLDEQAPTTVGSQVPGPRSVRVAWQTPDGFETVGNVTVPSDARPGSRVTVWTTTSGEPTDAPLTPSQISANAVAAGVLVQGLAMALAWLAFLVVRRVLDRRRYSAWENAWIRLNRGEGS